MSLKIQIAKQAENDAIAIAEHIAGESSLNTSDKFLVATTQAYRQLADMPGLGSPRNFGPAYPGLR